MRNCLITEEANTSPSLTSYWLLPAFGNPQLLKLLVFLKVFIQKADIFVTLT